MYSFKCQINNKNLDRMCLDKNYITYNRLRHQNTHLLYFIVTRRKKRKHLLYLTSTTNKTLFTSPKALV